MNIRMIRTVLLLWMVAMTITGSAQAVKDVAVSQEKSYTDHLALKNDSKDLDLMIKFVFNENKNTLTVSLISYRMLFVFWDSVRYKNVIKNRWIKPQQLSYVVNFNFGDQFRLTKPFRNSLSQPYKKHVCKKWIEVDGLQPAEMELNMVNDYIEQTFDIQGKRNNVVVRLRELMLMDEVRQKGASKCYEIGYGKDLNLEYHVTIQRNPCFGLEEEIAAAVKSQEAVQKSYRSLKGKYGKGKVATQEALNNFKELKATLVAQFPKNTDKSQCPDIQQAHDQYNLYVDSIQNMRASVAENPMATIGGSEGRALNAKSIITNARLLDSTVSRWLVSRDEMERADFEKQCRNIIKDTSVMIGSSSGQTPEERNAVTLFRNAEKYFKQTCKQ